MPVGACDRCQRRFVIEHERSPQRTCPHCMPLMRLTTAAEVIDYLRQSPERPPPPSSPEQVEVLLLDGAPLIANGLGRLLLTTLAESAVICREAAEGRQKARELRRRLAQEKAPPPVPTGELDTAA